MQMGARQGLWMDVYVQSPSFSLAHGPDTTSLQNAAGYSSQPAWLWPQLVPGKYLCLSNCEGKGTLAQASSIASYVLCTQYMAFSAVLLGKDLQIL